MKKKVKLHMPKISRPKINKICLKNKFGPLNLGQPKIFAVTNKKRPFVYMQKCRHRVLQCVVFIHAATLFLNNNNNNTLVKKSNRLTFRQLPELPLRCKVTMVRIIESKRGNLR